MKEITKETIIGDILDFAPETAPLFLEIGMHCLERIGHGFDIAFFTYGGLFGFRTYAVFFSVGRVVQLVRFGAVCKDVKRDTRRTLKLACRQHFAGAGYKRNFCAYNGIFVRQIGFRNKVV